MIFVVLPTATTKVNEGSGVETKQLKHSKALQLLELLLRFLRWPSLSSCS